MRLAVCALAFLTIVSQAAVAIETSAVEVPAVADWEQYRARGTAIFHVIACEVNDSLQQIINTAVDAWNDPTGHLVIQTVYVCHNNPRFGNGINEVYAIDGRVPDAHRALAVYRSNDFVPGVGEEDIVLSIQAFENLFTRFATEQERRNAMINVLIHEFGHALGLGHLRSLPTNCGAAIMRESACNEGMALSPTEMDLSTVRAIFGFEAPTQPERDITLTSFDQNDNFVLDDPEFLNIIDTWIDREIPDSLFFEAIDCWISQTPAVVCDWS